MVGLFGSEVVFWGGGFVICECSFLGFFGGFGGI